MHVRHYSIVLPLRVTAMSIKLVFSVISSYVLLSLGVGLVLVIAVWG